MMDVVEQEKIEALERILMALTRADEIRYRKYDGMDWLYVSVVGVDPNDFEFKGYSQGLDITWETEPYTVYPPEDMKDKLLPIQTAKIIAKVWVEQDMWEIIEDLKAQVENSKGSKTVDGQYSLGDYLMQEESLPCLHCGSDDTETRGHCDDGVAVSVTFWCYDCNKESTHIMGTEPQYWAKVKALRDSKVKDDE